MTADQLRRAAAFLEDLEHLVITHGIWLNPDSSWLIDVQAEDGNSLTTNAGTQLGALQQAEGITSVFKYQVKPWEAVDVPRS